VGEERKKCDATHFGAERLQEEIMLIKLYNSQIWAVVLAIFAMILISSFLLK
jgi:hypothetical protein